MEGIGRTIKVVSVAAAATVLAACGSDRFEGVMTDACIDGVTELQLDEEQQVFLGDLIADHTNGSIIDEAYIKNVGGRLVSDSTTNDDGVFAQTSDGLSYSENGRYYDITVGESVSGEPLNVTIETHCEDAG